MIAAQPRDRVDVVRRFITYAKELVGWVRDRALESIHDFGKDILEPALELLKDKDASVRASALMLAAAFDDPRVAVAAVNCLKDEDW